MLLIAGLGNPGQKYAGNRHNIGFMAAELIARRHNFSPWQKKFSAEIAEGQLHGEKTVLIKPQTFMNNSGQSVGEALRFYRLEPSNLTVIYDELDLVQGKLRVKTGGGSGGHNGIKSIDQHVGKDYRRIRLGIGHPGDKDGVLHHVLGDFAKADKVWLDEFLDAVADAAPLLAASDENAYANRVSVLLGKNERPDGPKPIVQSHIRQARPHTPDIKIPETGPMAAMLKRLFGKE
jgi:peptidyl-tRNA hydrolase, PTH1 family